jgi:carbonic anhydrase
MARPDPVADVADVAASAARSGLGRRQLLGLLGGTLLAGSLAACGGKAEASGESGDESGSVEERDDTEKLGWKDARTRLEEGNARFVEGEAAHPDQSTDRRAATGTGKQAPFAAVLSCVDSRVPPEIVFDQGLGDLFTVRTAGQVIDRAVLGSLQFGIAEFGIPLLVVLGHSGCGAVKATIEALEKHAAASHTDVDALVAAIAPAVAEARELGAKPEELLEVTVGANVERVVRQLGSAKVLGLASRSRKLKIVGAIYDLETGEVSFD